MQFFLPQPAFPWSGVLIFPGFPDQIIDPGHIRHAADIPVLVRALSQSQMRVALFHHGAVILENQTSFLPETGINPHIPEGFRHPQRFCHPFETLGFPSQLPLADSLLKQGLRPELPSAVLFQIQDQLLQNPSGLPVISQIHLHLDLGRQMHLCSPRFIGKIAACLLDPLDDILPLPPSGFCEIIKSHSVITADFIFLPDQGPPQLFAEFPRLDICPAAFREQKQHV